MKKYEYNLIYANESNLVSLLDSAGKNGWKAISILYNDAVYKVLVMRENDVKSDTGPK